MTLEESSSKNFTELNIDNVRLFGPMKQTGPYEDEGFEFTEEKFIAIYNLFKEANDEFLNNAELIPKQ